MIISIENITIQLLAPTIHTADLTSVMRQNHLKFENKTASQNKRLKGIEVKSAGYPTSAPFKGKTNLKWMAIEWEKVYFET